MYRDSAKLVIEDASSPSTAYAAYVRMDDLIEKLKLLNYDVEFVQNLKMKPVNRHYFAIPTNPGEQFYMFTSLAAWLIRKSGRKFDPPQESDDPNTTVSLILESLKEIGISADFSTNKLKQGVGEQAVHVLDTLADHALKVAKFKWQKVKITPDDPSSDPEIEEDDAELILEKLEEEMMADYEEEDEDVLHVDDIVKLYTDSNSNNTHRPEKILESKVDAEEWKMELERVLPQLKVTIQADSRDWRAYLDQVKQLHENASQDLSTTKSQLEKLYVDISNTLEKVSSREVYLNRQLEPYLEELRGLQEELSKAKEQYRDISGGVTERTRTLNNLTDVLEQVKREMDERGSSMTDGTPLINIKKTISKMKTEISEMSIRIGVLEYSLMCSRIKDQAQLQEDMNNTTTVSM